jgi:hypothetical protein
MPLSTKPIFPGAPWCEIGDTLTTANTNMDGTGTLSTVFTADSVCGGRIDFIKVRALGTNVATVIRVFVNNGGSNATPANNALIYEQTIAATTAAAAAALADNYIPLDYPLKPGWRVMVAIGTTVAAGLKPVGFGGQYNVPA